MYHEVQGDFPLQFGRCGRHVTPHRVGASGLLLGPFIVCGQNGVCSDIIVVSWPLPPGGAHGLGRMVMASKSLLDMQARVNWKNCLTDRERETEMTKQFRDRFSQFDPFNDDDNDSDGDE